MSEGLSGKESVPMYDDKDTEAHYRRYSREFLATLSQGELENMEAYAERTLETLQAPIDRNTISENIRRIREALNNK